MHRQEHSYLIVNSLIKVFNEDVALACLAQRRVALRPHNTAGSQTHEFTGSDKAKNSKTLPSASFYGRVVELLESALT